MKNSVSCAGPIVVTHAAAGVDVSRVKLSFLKIAFLCLIWIQSTVQAIDLTPESRLRKLSYQVRGLPPSENDFDELSKVKSSPSDTTFFFKRKLEAYFKSPWAAAKLSEKIFDDWRLENDSGYLKNSVLKNERNEFELSYPIMQVTEKSLIKHIQAGLSKGQTWDQILVQGSFRRALDVGILLQTMTYYYVNYGFKTKIANFKTEATAKGYKLDSIANIQAAIDDYEKNQTPQGTTLPTTTTAATAGATAAPIPAASSPYLRNSKIDPPLTILVIQGALDVNSPKLDELADYLGQLSKNLDNYRDDVLSISPAATSDQLPQLIFNLTDISVRYKKTIYSKAAAFFRIYLCDDMSPVILPGKNSKSIETFKLIHSEAPPTATNMSVIPVLSTVPAPPAVAIKAEHVKPECSGCHNKLNPMESVFNKKFAPLDSVTTKPNPFEFVYEDYTGKDIRLTIGSIDGLPDLLIKQPQYVRCQSEKFWNWFVGSDVPLNPKQRTELESVYVVSKSQPLEIIKYLTSLPLFSSDSFASEPKQFNNIRPILQKCHSCHKADPTIPSLLNIPFNADKKTMPEKMADHIEIIDKIVKLANLLNDQNKVRMPPKNAGWKLTENEKTVLLKWLSDGAKDESGTDTLSPEQKAKLFTSAKPEIMNAVRFQAKIEPSLKTTWQKILNYNDILRTLPFKLARSSTCFDDVVTKKFSLGHIDIFSGVPIVSQPDNAYREAYRQCLVQTLKSSTDAFNTLAATTPTSLEKIDSSVVFKTLKPLGLYRLGSDLAKLKPDENPLNVLKQFKWNTLSIEQKNQMIQEQINFVIGPNMNHVETELDLDKSVLIGVNRVMANNTAGDLVTAAFFSLYYILNSDSFLIY